ncbi:RDD family protein [Coraliomargarita sp. SDUM461003]|uniref:RDD family protein n=1 Tax=Thalassobacterium maritimum TaxID=3041265 RepID=A0ABU1B2F5_9BACT|nr:RDD family protein [Coraliomargarita sp. SDUM461003]MDQ8209602.1 RDD family protein [Coraliomargarita sp. SDUM461003]
MMDRVIAFFIDLMLISALTFCVGYIFDLGDTVEVLIALIYFPVTALLLQQSFGQCMMGLKIEVLSQQVNGRLLMLLRAILKIVGMGFFCLPLIPFWRSGNTKQSLLDIVSRTRVENGRANGGQRREQMAPNAKYKDSI